MLATYHNHTRHSDGQTSIADMVTHAARNGVDELGISDHLSLLPSGGTSEISLTREGLGAYVQEILSFSDQGRPRTRIGIEIDWFSSQAEDSVKDPPKPVMT